MCSLSLSLSPQELIFIIIIMLAKSSCTSAIAEFFYMSSISISCDNMYELADIEWANYVIASRSLYEDLALYLCTRAEAHLLHPNNVELIYVNYLHQL